MAEIPVLVTGEDMRASFFFLLRRAGVEEGAPKRAGLPTAPTRQTRSTRDSRKGPHNGVIGGESKTPHVFSHPLTPEPVEAILKEEFGHWKPTASTASVIGEEK